MMSKKKILISACLLEERVRYDGKISPNCPAILKEWMEKGWVVPVCPEVAGGLPIPRPSAEIHMGDGNDVVAGTAKVINISGKDVTQAFLTGAREALWLAEGHGIVCALLKARSPSCGSKMIYDGSFSGMLKAGQGVTAALLESASIRVYSEDEIERVASLIGVD